MKINKYLLIDKTIIKEGMTCEFNLFTTEESDKEMSCIKKRDIPITRGDKTIIDTAEFLYVHESEHQNYEHFRKTVLDSQEKVTIAKAVKNISFEEQASAIYKHAAQVLDTLFSHPEIFANYEASKEILNDMVETVTDENFKIKSLLQIATHDYHTHTHSINVTIYALSLGAFLNFKPNELSVLGEAALLHDLGKSKIDPAIINKDGKLTDEEFKEMKKHPELGYGIGLKLGIKNRQVLEGIRLHHEKMDGTGYPFKMRGESIPYYARIIGICDIFDAMTSRRSYKKPMTSFEALLLMKTKMHTQIDPKLLKSMIEMLR